MWHDNLYVPYYNIVKNNFSVFYSNNLPKATIKNNRMFVKDAMNTFTTS